MEQILRRQDTVGTTAAGSGAAGAGEPVGGLGDTVLEDPPSLTVLPAATLPTTTIDRPSLEAAATIQGKPSSASIVNPKLASGTPASVGSAGEAASAGQLKGSRSNAGAVAGAAVGCLLGGLIIGSLLAYLFLRRRSRKSASATLAAADVDGESSEKGSPRTNTVALPYVSKKEASSSPDIKALAAARTRIAALEKERNAASAFGDTLDKATESELVAKLAGVNERIAQLAMALGVQQTEGAKSGAGPVPRALSETAVAALQKPGVPLEVSICAR